MNPYPFLIVIAYFVFMAHARRRLRRRGRGTRRAGSGTRRAGSGLRRAGSRRGRGFFKDALKGALPGIGKFILPLITKFVRNKIAQRRRR